MSGYIPLEEMEGDLNATIRDISRLEIILQNIRGFIQDSHGEKRSNFHIDVMKYEALLSEAVRLREKIAEHMRERRGE